ncbi:MAG TPA: hypothetical protein VM735_13135, partial [Candidatus Kapabacteria bacterium]|nr:hypothetical protein [Candidatus Kapabacteria bacterium]
GSDIVVRMTNSVSMFEDKTFRRIVVGSTGLGLVFMFASLAAVQFGKNAGLEFKWHWSIAVVILVTGYWNARFWRIVWAAQENPGGTFRRKLMTSFAFLFGLGFATFLYPMRFVAPQHHLEISGGLLTAIIFLGITGMLIYKVGRAFVRADEVEAQQRQ